MIRSTSAREDGAVTIHGKDNYQLDGDVVGESTTPFAEIQPGALAICVPPKPAASRNCDPARVEDLGAVDEAVSGG